MASEFHDLRKKVDISHALSHFMFLKYIDKDEKDFEAHSRNMNNSRGELKWTMTLPARETVRAKQTVMELSPYFYSDTYSKGYKLRLTLFFRSDSVDMYATLGFEVRKGDDDNNQKWPFKMKTEIRYMSPDEKKEHKKIEFSPPSGDGRFSKPKQNSSGNNIFILDKIPSPMLDKIYAHTELLIKARLYPEN